MKAPRLAYASVQVRGKDGSLLLYLTNDGSHYCERDEHDVVLDQLTPENAYRTFHWWLAEPGARATAYQ